MKKEIQDAKDKMMEASEDYKEIRDLCKHVNQTWKSKYGGYFCEDCERFLPRALEGGKHA